MKRQLTLTMALLFSIFSFGQLCNFTSGNWPYSIQSNGGLFKISSGSPDYPVGATYGVDSSDAFVASGGEVILSMQAVNTAVSPASSLSFCAGAYGMTGSGKGMDQGTDYIRVEVRTSSALPWGEVLRVRGYGNALWAMDGELTASSLTLPSAIFTPDDGGSIESHRAVSKFVVDALPMADSLFIRFVLFSDRTVEEWGIDDIEFHPSVFWTNASGDGVTSNASNWSSSSVPDSNSAIFWSDTLPSLPASLPTVARLITYVTSPVAFPTSSVSVGEWVHLGGVLTSNSGIEVADQLGSGELIVVSDSVLGSMSVSRVFPFTEGYRHISSPLHSTWSDITDDASQVNYNAGAASSIFGWDATNENWYTLSSGVHQTKSLPVALFCGPNWVDSSTVLQVSGQLSQTDTFTVFYGTPNGNSPFASMVGNDGWNLLGNPFPYSISAEKLLSDVTYPSELSPTVYVWDGRDGTYSSFNLSTGVSPDGSSMIKPWQAFWVQFHSNPGVFRAVLVKPEHRGYSHQVGLLKSSLPSRDLIVQSSSEERRVTLSDVFNASLNWEQEYDQYQRNDRDFEVFFTGKTSIGDDVRIAVKSLDPFHAGGVPLIVECAEGEKIEIRMEDSNELWWLEDVLKDEWIQISDEPYSFISEQNEPYRFRVWRSVPLATSEHDVESISVPICSAGKWREVSSRTWVLYDLNGRRLMTLPADQSAVCNCPPGVYVWRSGELSQKVTIFPY